MKDYDVIFTAIDISERLRMDGLRYHFNSFSVTYPIPENVEPREVYRALVRIFADRYELRPTYGEGTLSLDVKPM